MLLRKTTRFVFYKLNCSITMTMFKIWRPSKTLNNPQITCKNDNKTSWSQTCPHDNYIPALFVFNQQNSFRESKKSAWDGRFETSSKFRKVHYDIVWLLNLRNLPLNANKKNLAANLQRCHVGKRSLNATNRLSVLEILSQFLVFAFLKIYLSYHSTDLRP